MIMEEWRISDLLNSTGVVVQGITGRQGRMETEWMLASGTRIAAGVTPGKGGQAVCGVPVYESLHDAVKEHHLAVSMVYAPPQAVVDAVDEALSAGIKLICVSAEGVPLHGMLRVAERAAALGCVVVGPNSQGIVMPGVGRLGCPGGTDPWTRFRPGAVAVVSRSGGLGSDVAFAIGAWGWGTSLQIHIGGSPTPATTLVDAVHLACAEDRTKVVVVLGEPTSGQEVDLADALRSGSVATPVVAMIPGRFVDRLPADLPFGHAPRVGPGQAVPVAEKLAALAAGGARVVDSIGAIQPVIASLLAGA